MGTDDNGYELAICSSSADEQEVRFAMDSSLEGEDLPPIIKRKKQGNNPAGYRRDAVPLGEA